MFIPWYMYMQFFFLHILFKIHQAVNSSNLGNIHDYNSTEHEMMFKKDILS